MKRRIDEARKRPFEGLIYAQQIHFKAKCGSRPYLWEIWQSTLAVRDTVIGLTHGGMAADGSVSGEHGSCARLRKAWQLVLWQLSPYEERAVGPACDEWGRIALAL